MDRQTSSTFCVLYAILENDFFINIYFVTLELEVIISFSDCALCVINSSNGSQPSCRVCTFISMRVVNVARVIRGVRVARDSSGRSTIIFMYVTDGVLSDVVCMSRSIVFRYTQCFLVPV